MGFADGAAGGLLMRLRMAPYCSFNDAMVLNNVRKVEYASWISEIIVPILNEERRNKRRLSVCALMEGLEFNRVTEDEVTKHIVVLDWVQIRHT